MKPKKKLYHVYGKERRFDTLGMLTCYASSEVIAKRKWFKKFPPEGLKYHQSADHFGEHCLHATPASFEETCRWKLERRGAK